MILYILISLSVVVAARPNEPSVIHNANRINSIATGTSSKSVFSQTIESHKTNIVHDYRSKDNPALPNTYVEREPDIITPHPQLVRKHTATPYGHHGFFSGHVGQLFHPQHNPASYFWYPPALPALSLPPPAAAPAPAPAPAQQGPAEPMPATIPLLIPLAAQILGELFWMPLEHLLINVQQSLFQPPKTEKSD